MSIELPDDIFNTYYEVVDSMTNDWFGVDCLCSYPPRKSLCTNCIHNNITGKSTNIYNGTGPYPFSNSICPYCSGEGALYVNETDTIKLRVYYSRKDWKKVPIPINLSDGAVQVYGFLTDLPKIKRSEKVTINSKESGYGLNSYNLSGEPIIHGLKKNRYFIAFLDLFNG